MLSSSAPRILGLLAVGLFLVSVSPALGSLTPSSWVPRPSLRTSGSSASSMLRLRGGVEIEEMDEGTDFESLNSAVQQLKQDPELLHKPELRTFREYLTSLGATLPPKPSVPESQGGEEVKAEAPNADETMEEEDKQEEEEEEEEEEAEDDDVEIIPEELGDVDTVPTMGDTSREPADDDFAKSAELKGNAMEALAGGEVEMAVTLFSQVIDLTPNANAFASRGQAFLKIKKPVAALRDAEKALEINPDSAKALKVKGRAEGLLGRWTEAVKSLNAGQAIDFDEDTAEFHKEIQPRADKIHRKEAKDRAKRQKAELKEREKELKRRKEEAIKRRQQEMEEEEAAAKAQGGMPGMGGMGGMPGAPPGMENLFSDPEIMAAMSNPKIQQALMEMQTGGPAAMAKYASDPEVMNIMMKLQSKMGGMGGGPPGGMGGMGGMPGMGGMGGMPGMGGMGGMPGMGGMGGMGGMPGDEVD